MINGWERKTAAKCIELVTERKGKKRKGDRKRRKKKKRRRKRFTYGV